VRALYLVRCPAEPKRPRPLSPRRNRSGPGSPPRVKGHDSLEASGSRSDTSLTHSSLNDRAGIDLLITFSGFWGSRSKARCDRMPRSDESAFEKVPARVSPQVRTRLKFASKGIAARWPWNKIRNATLRPLITRAYLHQPYGAMVPHENRQRKMARNRLRGDRCRDLLKIGRQKFACCCSC
jgi:hypothetical protein